MTIKYNLLILLTFVLPLFVHATAWEQHPRLFLTPERLQEIRKAVTIPGSHHQQAFKVLQAKVDQNNFRLFGATETNWNYARAYLAQAAAFLYQVTADSTYAHIAYQAVYAIFSKPDPERRLPYSESYGDQVDRNYGLSRATVGLGLAYAYDWCFPAWNAAQRTFVKEQMLKALEGWKTYRHANLESEHQASNWVAVCRGGELILLLAACEEKQRHERYTFLKNSLKSHLQNAYSPAGFTQEGIAYCSYAGIFLLPAIYALESLKDYTLREQAATIAWWKWLMYAGTFITAESGQRKVMQTGVSGIAPPNEGWASLLLNLAPKEELPHYLYFYDRHEGRLSSAAPDQKYDASRAGTVWALLYYPVNLQAKDPSGEAGFSVLKDEQSGMYYLRNRWRDEQDIIISMMADKGHHSHAWDQPEAFQLLFAGFNTFFTQGPSKNRQAYTYSTLLIDGQNSLHHRNHGHTGGEASFEAGAGTHSYIRIMGGEKYRQLGVHAQRDAIISFPAPGAALIALTDYIQSDSSHTYTSNLYLGEKVEAQLIQTDKKHAEFVLHGKENAYVKGWVLPPWDSPLAEPPVKLFTDSLAAQALQIHAQGKSSSMRVVMVIGKGKPPAARILTKKRRLIWQMGKTRIWWNKDTRRIHSNHVNHVK